MGSLYGVAYFTLAVSYARKMLMKWAIEKFYKVCPKLINGTNGCLDEMLYYQIASVPFMKGNRKKITERF
jgi:hypothetical protein